MRAQSQMTRERVRAAWMFLSPMLIVLLLVAAWPLARTIWFGFTDANLSAISDWRFIGFDNYLVRYDGEWFGLLADGDWWRAVYNTLWFAAVSVTLETVLGMIVALVLHSAFAGRGLVRAAVLIPWAIPTIVSAKMWSWMLNDQFGVINAMLMTLGLIDAPVAWTADPATAMWAVVMVDVWKTTPFMALLLLAGLQMIPVDCYEAARIDGVQRGAGLLQGDAAADQAGADRRGHLPRARRVARVRPHIRDHRELARHDVDVGLCAPAAGRFPGGRHRLGGLDAAVHGDRSTDGDHADGGPRRPGGQAGAMKAERLLKQAALTLLVALIVFYSVFPFYYAVITSFRSGSAIFSTSILPAGFALDNYVATFTEQPFARNIVNSIVVATGVVIASLFLGVTAAYALARVSFRGRGLLLFTILSVSMFPQVAVLSGMFELVRALGLYNSLPGLMLSNMILTLPFTVWVLTTFMRELPKELEEAAVVDGASDWVIVRRVFLPLLGPALVTTGLLAFIAAWNEFLFALTFTLTNEQRTVPVAIALITGASAEELPWGNIMAATVIVTVPLIVLVLVFQRRIVAGLTAGAVKG